MLDALSQSTGWLWAWTRVTPAETGVYLFSMTTSVCAFWEILEFTTDSFFGTHEQGGNFDTMTDLICDFAGAATGLFYLGYSGKLRARLPKQVSRVTEVITGVSPPDPYTEAVLKVEEDRGEEIGRKAEVEVPVTVRVKASLIVRADDGADVDRAVELWAKGKRYGKADVAQQESEIVAVDGIDHWDDYTTHEDWLTEAVEAKLDGAGCKVVKSEVTDSK